MFKSILVFISLIFTIFPAYAGLFQSKPTFLPADQAFSFSSEQVGDQLRLHWQIADGYYLYKKEIKIQGQDLQPNMISLPDGEHYQDEFFGDVEIYREDLHIPVMLNSTTRRLEVRYQGCTKGFCYPPELKVLDLNELNHVPQAVENRLENTKEPLQTEQVQLAQHLSQTNIAVFWFFILGIGLAFTPCVLPMLPLLSAIVIGKQQRPSSVRAFLLSLVYVQGMALTYTLLGLIVAAIGLPFQIALQSPPVLIGLSLLFIILACSMFGLFELRLPHTWQQKLNQISQQQQGGSLLGVFVMGMLAGLVASPCTSAPLSGALLYVVQSGDLWIGGLALYLLAFGMGIPLILITLFGNRILPKSGDWLLNVKTLFGFVMLALPVFLLSRIFPELEEYAWSALAMALLIWVYEKIGRQKVYQKVAKVVLIALLVLVAKPFSDLIWQENRVTAHETVRFERVSSLNELQQKLIEVKGKKVMFDLYADWCVACKEFEKYTFSAPSVSAKLEEMVVFQIDMTRNSVENDEIMRHFQILGLPSILFFDEQGEELKAARLTGFLAAEPFLEWLNAL